MKRNYSDQQWNSDDNECKKFCENCENPICELDNSTTCLDCRMFIYRKQKKLPPDSKITVVVVDKTRHKTTRCKVTRLYDALLKGTEEYYFKPCKDGEYTIFVKCDDADIKKRYTLAEFEEADYDYDTL